MATPLKNIIVVGGSYVGKGTAQKLAQVVPPTHRVLLIEPHSHFHHIFTFPRFAVSPGHEHKAFIPYSATFSSAPNASHHAIIPARVISLRPDFLELDRIWQGSKRLSFDCLVIATGTKLSEPSAINEDEKSPAVEYLRKHQDSVKQSRSILIVGGGAAGVQMATDIKEYYPDKEVTLVQSRDRLMPKFHSALHDIIKRRFDDLGIKFVTGARVVVPSQGFPTQRSPITVELTNGSSLNAEFCILATGQKPNNALVAGLESSNGKTLINSQNGMLHVRPTLQLADPKYENIFAVGDIADTGAHKAARPGIAQAVVVASNIEALLKGDTPKERFVVAPAAIHMSLGMKYNVVFRNPNPAEGMHEPTVIEKYDGREDMDVDGFWQRMGLNPKIPHDYNL